MSLTHQETGSMKSNRRTRMRVSFSNFRKFEIDQTKIALLVVHKQPSNNPKSPMFISYRYTSQFASNNKNNQLNPIRRVIYLKFTGFYTINSAQKNVHAPKTKDAYNSHPIHKINSTNSTLEVKRMQTR